MKLFLLVFLFPLLALGSPRSIDADQIKSSDHTKTWTLPSVSGTLTYDLGVPPLVLSTTLTGLSTATSSAITSSDTVLSADGKLQAQINTNAALIGGKEPTITAGTTSQYWRGDKSWQTLDKTAVGLSNVDNTSDANKPVSTAQQTALNLKIDKSAATAKGDLLVGTAASTVSHLPIGTNDYVLTADSTQTTGIKWAAASGGGSGSGGINLEANNDPEISSGVSNWSSTGTTPSYVTTGTGIGIFDSKGYLSWDSAAAGEEICLPQVSVDSLASNNGQLLVYSRVPSGTATHEFRIYDGAGNLLKSLPITSTTTPYPNSTNLPFPTTGNTLEFCVHAIAANEPSIDIDHIYLGQTTNITSVENISDWADFPSVAAGTLITATTTPPSYGTVATNKARWRRVGTNMEIEWDFKQTSAGSAGSGIYLFNLPPGYVIDTSKKTANTSTTYGGGYADGAVGKIDTNYSAGSGHGGAYVYSTTQLKFDMLLYNGGANGGTWHNGGGADFSYASQDVHVRASVPIQGWSTNQSAAAANQTNYGRTSYTPTFTGFGAVTSPNCWHRRDGEFLHWECTFTSGTPTATEARATLPNSLTSKSSTYLPTLSIVGKCARSVSGAESGYVLIEPSTGYVTFGLAFSSGAGLVKQNGSTIFGASGQTLSCQADIPIDGWTENNKASTLIGSVTSDSSSALRIESVRFGGAVDDGVSTHVCNSTPCTIEQQSSSWVTSVSRSAVGTYAINIPAGTFSAKPTCTLAHAGSVGYAWLCGAYPTSATSVAVNCTNSATNAALDAIVSLICMGPR